MTTPTRSQARRRAVTTHQTLQRGSAPGRVRAAWAPNDREKPGIRQPVYIVDDDASARSSGSLLRSEGLSEDLRIGAGVPASPRLDPPSCLVLDVSCPGSRASICSRSSSRETYRSDHFSHRSRRHTDVVRLSRLGAGLSDQPWTLTSCSVQSRRASRRITARCNPAASSEVANPGARRWRKRRSGPGRHDRAPHGSRTARRLWRA